MKRKPTKKATPKRVSKRIPVPKPFNHGTMTKSMFLTMVRSALRQKSRWWKPILATKAAARRAYKGPNKLQKWEYQCNVCKKWFKGTQVIVDHIKPVGTLTEFSDLPAFVLGLFCEVDNLQAMCSTCHDAKTKIDLQQLKT